jgi:hypothetical protein
MCNTRFRALVREPFADQRVVYFCAMEQDSKELKCYTDRRHRYRAEPVYRKYITRVDQTTGLSDSLKLPIYNNDVMGYVDILDGIETLIERLVFWRNGTFGVDESRVQGELVSVTSLSKFLREETKAKIIRHE